MQKTIMVVPCYNEEKRINFQRFQSLLNSNPELNLLFVDDGSEDNTAAILKAFSQQDRVRFKKLNKNVGKAEAVRQGLIEAIDFGPDIVGYVDVDFATPEVEILRLLAIASQSNYRALLGSRVRLLGTNIQRKWWRHYLGRIFATAASLALGLPLYDTQCGLKFFRVTHRLRDALMEPFGSRWVFDVELIGRLISRKQFSSPALTPFHFREVPLEAWEDVGGSKLGLAAMVKAGLDVIALGISLRLPYKKSSLVPLPTQLKENEK